jgi:hypothetical protein
MRDTATSGDCCHGRSYGLRVEVSWQMDAATAIAGVGKVFANQWVTAPQCAGGGVSREGTRGMAGPGGIE